jgi:patatin-related protein
LRITEAATSTSGAGPPREKELRLALVCYGGVSLVIYMHGVTKELWKLLKASEAAQAGRPAPAGDTEGVWHALLADIGRTLDLKIVCDVAAGASAGGINSIILAEGIVSGIDLEPLTAMWLEKADVDALLDPDARPGSRLVRFYKEPVAWFARSRSATLATLRDDPAGREVSEKLGAFVRSRWFKPPFSGPGFTAMLDAALGYMQAQPYGPPLLPAGMPFDLFVTVTDYFGTTSRIPIHSPSFVTETEHRRLLSFRAEALPGARDADGAPRRTLGSRPSLVFAARATASFPGAFPAASLAEMDRIVEERGLEWPDRATFVAEQLGNGRPEEEILLIDGSVLENAPFEPAIEAIKARAAFREVDRRFVYIDPKPGLQLLDGGVGRRRAPGFLTVMLRALAQIPREQPIRDNLEAIADLSADLARVRRVVEGMTPAVEATMARVVGARFFLLRLTPERLARARAAVETAAAREAGFAWAGYAHLRLDLVLAEAAATLARLAGVGGPAEAAIASALRAVALSRGVVASADETGRAAAATPFARLITAQDSAFRIRRLRFLIRRLNLEIGRLPAASARAAEALKAALHAVTAPFVAARAPAQLEGRVGAAARALAADPADPALAAAALDRLGEGLALPALDVAADSALLEALEVPALERAARRAVLRDWLGFPFYDIALLPLGLAVGVDALEDVKVDRISPDDATSLGLGGTQGVLKGWQLNAFGAFFSRAWRENDYLWGRLNAADRLTEIIASTLPPGADFDAEGWKRRLFRAIVDHERGQLREIGPLFGDLEREMDEWGAP